MLLTNFKSENKYAEYIPILICFLSLVYHFIPTHEVHKMITNFIKRENKYVSITISSHEIPVIRSMSTTPITKLVYSNTFLSIVYYLSTNKECKISSLTEIMTNNTELNMYCFDDHHDWKKKDQFMFIPMSNDRFLICSAHNIFCEFNELTCEENEDEGDKSKSNVAKNRKFVITLSLDSVDTNDLAILQNFVKDCLEKYMAVLNNKKDSNSQYIFEYKNYEKEDNKLQLVFDEFPLQNNKDLLKNIFFEEKEKLITYITPFVYDTAQTICLGEEKYKRSGFTFKAGLLFYGYPGCGKTSTIKGILNYTKRHAVVVNLSKIKTCEELQSIFRRRNINGRDVDGKQLCYILEDCDAVENSIIQTRHENEDGVKKRDYAVDECITVNKLIDLTEASTKIVHKQEDALNLSCFLNILDGIIELHGIMIIMTTNYPERIDEALIRPGRFDFKYEFKKSTRNMMRQMIQFKYELSDEEMVKYTEMLDVKDYALSPAEIQCICFKNEKVDDCIREIVLACNALGEEGVVGV
jgi:hypothetical protein